MGFMAEKDWGEQSYQKIFAYIEEHGPAMLPELIERKKGDYWGVAQSLIYRACMDINFDVEMKLERDSDGDLCLDGNNFFYGDDINIHMYLDAQCEESYEMVRTYIENHGPAMLPELIRKNEGDRRSVALSLIHRACFALNLG
jgi:hypothetical protein